MTNLERNGSNGNAEKFRRGELLAPEATVFVRSGLVGEIVNTKKGPKILFIAHSGELAGGLPPKRPIVLSRWAEVPTISQNFFSTPEAPQYLQAGLLRRVKQLDELSVQNTTAEKIAFALHELTSKNHKHVDITHTHLAQWLGLSVGTVSLHLQYLQLAEIIKKQGAGGINVLDRNSLGQIRQYARPLNDDTKS